MSEVTRAEQLAERLMACSTVDFDGDFMAAAVELRRLSAVEADRDRWQRNRDMWKDQSFAQAVELHELRERLARQSALLQKAKEAIEAHKNRDFHSDHPKLAAFLSAINEWEKSNG